MDGPFFRSMWEHPHFQTCFPQRRSDHHHHYSHPDARPAYCPPYKQKLTIPVHDGACTEPSKPASHAKSSVVIPVHFAPTSKPLDVPPKRVDSPSQSTAKASTPGMSNSDAAVKIQSAFRGFSLRKSAPLKILKEIFQVKGKMEEIRERLQKPPLVDSIRGNEKERIRISEEIMTLLLKLDAIQGVNSDLREARKSVVRELIKLQQTVDAIVANKSTAADADDPAVEASVMPEIVSSPEKPSKPRESDAAANVAKEDVKIEGSSHCPDKVGLIAEQKEFVCNSPEVLWEGRQNVPFLPLSSDNKVAEQPPNSSCGQDARYMKGYTVDSQDWGLGKVSVPCCTEDENIADVRQVVKCADSKEIDIRSKLQAEVNPKGSIWPEEETKDSVFPEDEVKGFICSNDEAGTCNLESTALCDDEIVNGKWQLLESKGRMRDANLVMGMQKDEGKDNRPAMETIGKAIDGEPKSEAETRGVERTREDNKKLKKMVADLSQRNDMQSDIISNLSQRIEQLEKRILQLQRNRKRKDRRKKKNATNNS